MRRVERKKRKDLIILLIIISLSFLAVLFFKKVIFKPKEDVSILNEEIEKEDKTTSNKIKKIRKNMKEYDFSYSPSIEILSFEKKILIYNGKKLVLKDMDFKDYKALRIASKDFLVKTSKDSIYLVDKIDKIIYKINKDLEIEKQEKFTEEVKNLYVLNNGLVGLCYFKEPSTDGLLVYSEDLRLNQTMEYPNAVIMDVLSKSVDNKMIVATQFSNKNEILCGFYTYNNNLEAESLYQFKNLLLMKMISEKNVNLLLDPFFLAFTNDEYKETLRIESFMDFQDILVSHRYIYLKDGYSKVRVFEKDGKPVKELSFNKDTLLKILPFGEDVIFVLKNEISFPNLSLPFSKDIKNAIIVADRLVVITNSSISILNLNF